MNKMKISGLVRIIIFCLAVFGCAAITIIMPDATYSDRENRELAQMPKLTRASFLSAKFQKRYENYINDQFIFRDELADMSVRAQICLGYKDINDVYIGKDGYLLERLSDEDEDLIENNIDILSQFLNYAVEEYGADHVRCMMIPSKAEAMPDKLPSYAPLKAHDVTDRLAGALDNKDILIDVRDTMRNHQDEYIYYRTDHHWTTLGAGYAYNRLRQSYGQELLDISPEDMTERYNDFYGTTYNKAGVNVAQDIVYTYNGAAADVNVCMNDEDYYDSMYFEHAAVKGFNRYELFFGGNTFKIVVDTHAGTGRTLLLVKDSYANCFVPYLTNDYDRIIMIDYRYGKQAAGSILDEYEDISDVLVMYNTDKLVTNNKLTKLADISRSPGTEDSQDSHDTDKEQAGSGLEEFDIDDFLGELE